VNGVPLEKILTERLHPVLIDDLSAPKIEYDSFLDEMDAISHYGLNEYLNAPREWQILMVSHMKARATLKAISEYEAWHKDGR
jgi:hypothetical protein